MALFFDDPSKKNIKDSIKNNFALLRKIQKPNDKKFYVFVASNDPFFPFYFNFCVSNDSPKTIDYYLNLFKSIAKGKNLQTSFFWIQYIKKHLF